METLDGLSGQYGCVYADPPWSFKSNSASKPGRNPKRHYGCMSLDDIAALPVKQHAADDCVLFMWITGPFLAVGAHIPIMKAWGFKPSGMGFDWVKLNPRAPRMFMVESEEARRRVRQYVGPDVRVAELFARSRAAGPLWDCWGNEVEKFGGANAA